MFRHQVLVGVTAVAAALGCAGMQPARPAPVCGYEVVDSHEHDTNAYTQGLLYDDGRLFESTGLNGHSTLREVELDTGAVLREVELDREYFAEGIAVVDGRIHQLTWQSGTAFVYDRDSFGLVDEWSYSGEGWGLTTDGRFLVMSDGTSTLRFIDTTSFAEVRRLGVTDDGMPVERLNELEYIDGEIWANVWQTDRIARIDSRSGAVTAWVDLTGLLGPQDRTPTAEVLNGIAYDKLGDRLFVTGKLWPRLYEIRVAECPA